MKRVLDNRRENLRICTRRQNQANRRPYARSGFKGVVLHRGLWRVHMGPPGNKRFAGPFPTAEAAALAADRFAQELYGEFAYLNFPEAA
jgi:hypothetical protein